MGISPPQTSSSPSSSDFEFTVSHSPTSRKPSLLCPADELFYKGQLLPLHLSPRLSMVRALLASSSSSSSDATADTSRDSTESSVDSTASDFFLLPDCDSARPSSATDDLFTYEEEFKKPKKFKHYLPSLLKFSSVFARRENKNANSVATPTKRVTATAKEVIRKYVKKVKPLYEKLASKQNLQAAKTNASVFSIMPSTAKPSLGTVGFTIRRGIAMDVEGFGCGGGRSCSHSFSENLSYPRRRRCVSSCPSSMRSSPSHSGILRSSGGSSSNRVGGMYLDSSSSMEELQNAIQGAIAHCKKSMIDGDQQQTTTKGEDI